MTFLSRSAILNADDLKTEVITVPEWNGDVRLRVLTAAERDSFEAGLRKGEGKSAVLDLTNLRARLVALAIIDENGQRVFSDDDVAQLGKKHSGVIGRLFDAVQKLNGMTAEAVETAEKN